jgi:oxygen-independent coproporphyrinogen-3 oxidase
MPLGLYISVPFCRTKCSFCNFASDVFSRAVFQRYVARVCADVERAAQTAKAVGGRFEPAADTIYLGGGTPTVLDIDQLEQIFVTISQNFQVAPQAEITVEFAPGTLTAGALETFRRCRVNRVSLGVQSFVDGESRSVGRLHTREIVLRDLEALRNAGISDINVDLIAGLPYQTSASWEFSLDEAIACGAPHVSVYMLEVDDDSRLGREVIAGGTRYHAHFIPDEELTAGFYERACERLERAGIHQYEISNFARDGCESQHNLKYWLRQPYFGFGVDAHSMLPAEGANPASAVRFATPDGLEKYVADEPLQKTDVSPDASLEEAFFLGLRLNRGVNLKTLHDEFGRERLAPYAAMIRELAESRLLEYDGDGIRLTARGRLLSNEVFEKFIALPAS